MPSQNVSLPRPHVGERHASSWHLIYAKIGVLHGWRAGGGIYALGQRWGDDQDTFERSWQ
jgi:hypothetical protein